MVSTIVDGGETADDETATCVTMETIVDWSFDDLRHTREREEKLEWGAARQLSPEAKACDLTAPFAWLYEKLTTARPEAARSVARAIRVPRRAAPRRDRAYRCRWRFVRVLEAIALRDPSDHWLLATFMRLGVELGSTDPFWCVRRRLRVERSALE